MLPHAKAFGTKTHYLDKGIVYFGGKLS